MTYEQDKQLRRLTYKLEVIGDLIKYADFSRRCELETERDQLEREANALYDQIHGGKNEVRS